MHDYTHGAGMAFLALAKKFLKKDRKLNPENINRDAKNLIRVNILGMTPLDFAAEGSVDTLVNLLKAEGFSVTSCWAMERDRERANPKITDMPAICRSIEADVNLVVSSVGMPVAEFLETEYGIPFVIGLPIGTFAEDVWEALCKAVKDRSSRVAYFFSDKIGCGNSEAACVLHDKEESGDTYDEAAVETRLIGEPVFMGSLAAHLQKCGQRASVVCATEVYKGLLREKDCAVRGEYEIRQALKGAKMVVGDPLFRAVSPRGAAFVPIPHLAFSGRLYRKSFLNIMEKIPKELGGC